MTENTKPHDREDEHTTNNEPYFVQAAIYFFETLGIGILWLIILAILHTPGGDTGFLWLMSAPIVSIVLLVRLFKRMDNVIEAKMESDSET